MGTVTRPAAHAAKSSSVHSYVVRAMIATRSPARQPLRHQALRHRQHLG
ncbi:hypothetical protein GA0115255_1232015, partial [Streptomyces sp. Ncost-T6T-2b]